jgi:hypothetical protein
MAAGMLASINLLFVVYALKIRAFNDPISQVAWRALILHSRILLDSKGFDGTCWDSPRFAGICRDYWWDLLEFGKIGRDFSGFDKTCRDLTGLVGI